MEKNVMEMTFLTEKSILHVPFHSLEGAKVEGGQKLTQVNNKKTRIKSTFVFFVFLFFISRATFRPSVEFFKYL